MKKNKFFSLFSATVVAASLGTVNFSVLVHSQFSFLLNSIASVAIVVRSITFNLDAFQFISDHQFESVYNFAKNPFLVDIRINVNGDLFVFNFNSSSGIIVVRMIFRNMLIKA